MKVFCCVFTGLFYCLKYAGELFTTVEDKPEHRSADFVDSLLSVDKSGDTVKADVKDSTHQEKVQMLHIVEYTEGSDHHAQSMSSFYFLFLWMCVSINL